MRVSRVLVPYGKQGGGRTVVTFPFAGGKADLFKDWHHFFDSVGLGVLSVQYRGRFPEGMKDVVLKDIEEVAAEVATALEEELKEGVVFFYGHSYGALVAWLVAGLLQQRNSKVRVVRVFVGGEESPSRPVDKSGEYAKMTMKDFAAHLVKRKMLQPRQVNNADASFLEMLEPTKTEFQIDHEFDLAALRNRPAKLQCPISAFYEAEDDSFGLRVEHVETWSDFSEKTAAFECTPIYGPHLFLLEEHNETELTDMIKERIAADLKSY